MMFALRQLLEKCREQHQELHAVFVDLVKAFDTVSRPLMWALLKKIGIPPKVVNIIQSFHNGMEARVLIGGEFTEPFPVTNGLRQGCILAPTLFILLFSFVLRNAHKDIPDFGVDIKHKLDGKLFNLKAKSIPPTRLDEFLYADDAALATKTCESLQEGVTALNNSCVSWGLTISKPKTEVMHVQCEDPTTITIEGTQLKRAYTVT